MKNFCFILLVQALLLTSSFNTFGQTQTVYQVDNKDYYTSKSEALSELKAILEVKKGNEGRLKIKIEHNDYIEAYLETDASKDTPFLTYNGQSLSEKEITDVWKENFPHAGICAESDSSGVEPISFWVETYWDKDVYTAQKHYSRDYEIRHAWEQRVSSDYGYGSPKYICDPRTDTHIRTIDKRENYVCPSLWVAEVQNDKAICNSSTEFIKIKYCHAPFVWSETDNECITWCPPNASGLDEDLGRCKSEPIDECSVKVLNPINASSGEKIEYVAPDFIGKGSFPLLFSRNYQSYRAPQASPLPSIDASDSGWKKYFQPSDYAGGLMPQRILYKEDNIPAVGHSQWSHNYHHSLLIYSEGNKALLKRGNGQELYFTSTDGLSFNSDKHFTGDSLTKSDAKYVYTNSKGMIETYNASGQLTNITNQQGLSLLLAYNAAGKLETVTDPAGRTLTFSYDDNGRLSKVTEPSGQVITYGYGVNGNLTTATFPDNTPENASDNPRATYIYGDASHPYALTEQTDENGNVKTTWTYDAQGRATGSSNNGGHKTGTIAYGENTATITEGNGHERTLTFDTKGRLSSVTGGNCGQCSSSDVASYSYDNKNQLISKTDFNGAITTFEYNARGLQTKRTEASGTPLARVTTTDWHSDYALPTKVTSPTLQLDYVYGVRGRLESITETDLMSTSKPTRVTTYSYNETGLLVSIDGPHTDVTDTTTFTYDANHDLASTTDAAGNTTTISARNANGYPTSITDANGVVTTLAYDVRNRLVSQTVNGSYTTSFTYDNVGQLMQVTLPSGAVTKYTYNGARLLTSIEDGLGNSIEYTYDVMGNVTKVDVKDAEDTLYATQQQVFDGLNRITSQIDGLDNTTVFGYDAVGNQVSIKTPLLRETQQVYDALNRLSETTDANTNKTTYSYDAADNLTSVKAANDATTTYSYDGFGNLLSQTSPDTGITTFTYDVAGNQLSKTDAKGVTVNYRYDALNRLTGIDYPDDNLDVSLIYDTGTNGKGRLSQITDGSGSTQYSYDVLGNITSKTTTISGKSFTVSYAYKGANQLTQLILPSGRAVNLTRNTHGLVTDITETKGEATNSLLTSASYVPFGQAKSFTLGNGKTTTRVHNLNGQLTSITVNDVYQSSIGYNSDSTITNLASALKPANDQSYSYDELDRLIGATGSYGTLAYSYDSVSNRITKTDNGDESSLSYLTQSNQLASPFLHDANGNRIKDSKRTYSYGEHNRLTQVINDENGLTTTYLYNGLGQRVKKQNLFGEVYFLYDEQGLLIAEANAQGNITKEYVYFEGQPLVMMVGEE